MRVVSLLVVFIVYSVICATLWNKMPKSVSLELSSTVLDLRLSVSVPTVSVSVSKF